MEKRAAVDLVNLMCGEKLGSGAFRTVFACRLDDSLVLKHDNRNNHSNIFEYELWGHALGTELEKWLAPVECISEDGFWLVQQRTQPLRKEELPEKVPAIFCDFKPENWGMLDGRPVCHDYGNSRVFALALRAGKRLEAANWM